MDTLADGILEEQKRCRGLLSQYEQIGPSGAFGARMIEAVLEQTDKAVIEGDVVAMIRCYEQMKAFK